MSQTNILLEAGTNELEVVEFYLDEFVPPSTDAPQTDENGQPVAPASYRGYYGVNVAKVLEIIRMPKVTELPEVQHPSVLGAFNLRSRIIPLVDLAMWLGKTHPANEEQPKTIVTEFNNVTTAFMVSGVNRIHRISWEQVEPPNKYVAAVSNNTVIGVVKLEDRIIFLLDLEKVVANLNPKLGLRLDDLGEDWPTRATVPLWLTTLPWYAKCCVILWKKQALPLRLFPTAAPHGNGLKISSSAVKTAADPFRTLCM